MSTIRRMTSEKWSISQVMALIDRSAELKLIVSKRDNFSRVLEHQARTVTPAAICVKICRH